LAEPSNAGNERVYVFGPFRLFPSRQLLMQGDRRVQLGARAFELLTLMVQRSGEVVGRDELVSAAWPNVFVHESNLKVNMSSLRRSLGDTQKQPTYIATVTGRGYRFVSAVQASTASVVEERAPAETARMRGLPPQPDIVGRESDIADVLAALNERRHVTVVGTGGVGKTTVAIAAAQAFAEHCPDGVCFVDFSTAEASALVPATLAAALGVRGDPADALTAVIGYLEQRRLLVLLDNCEHVLPGVAAQSPFAPPVLRWRVYAELAPSDWQQAHPRLQGYLRGFIDLVFEQQGRYWVLDWKSNHLGERPADYAAAALERAMAAHGYTLQALLYLVALHRHLARRLPDYRYEQHVGGALYLFVRGVRPGWLDAHGAPGGVHLWRPPLALVERVSALFQPQARPAPGMGVQA